MYFNMHVYMNTYTRMYMYTERERERESERERDRVCRGVEEDETAALKVGRRVRKVKDAGIVVCSAARAFVHVQGGVVCTVYFIVYFFLLIVDCLFFQGRGLWCNLQRFRHLLVV
jgi:hypothetical protein